MSDNAGGPAFPSHGSMGEVTHEGMTLRDYFAAKASDKDIEDQASILMTKKNADGEFDFLPDDWRAVCRYMHADAMLKERAK